MTRAKFQVTSIEQFPSGYKVNLLAVTATSEENSKFFKWTPSGSISMQIVSEETAKTFEVGKNYYVDFTLSDPQSE